MAASATGACTLRPSPAIPSALTSAARHGSSALPRAGWRGSSAESDLGSPSPSRDDRFKVDSSTPSSAGTPAGATPPPSQAAPYAENSASSSRPGQYDP